VPRVGSDTSEVINGLGTLNSGAFALPSCSILATGLTEVT
jgi:hypothetical protein